MNWNPLNWLEYGVSWVLVQFHSLFSLVLDPDSGVAWALSIVGLVVIIRIALIPLFVKQIKSQRNLQILQPKMKEIQQKYKGDRQKQSEETMKLYKETGTNPLASCLPILVQAPFFFALFQVLQGIATISPKGVMTGEQAQQAHDATIFGVPLYGTFMDAEQTPNPTATHVLTVIMIILMTATTFITQRQLMIKNAAPGNPMVRQQKILLYVFPLFFAFTGVHFPVGVLLYWLTTNLWSMGQQFYVIRNNPQPGTPAFDAWERRQAAKAVKRGEVPEPVAIAPVAPRQQPKKQTRSQRATAKPATGTAGTSGAGSADGAGPGGTATSTAGPPADAGSSGSGTNGSAANGSSANGSGTTGSGPAGSGGTTRTQPVRKPKSQRKKR